MKITVTMELTQENLSKLRALLPDTEIPGQVSMFDSPSEKPVEVPKTEAPAPATEAPKTEDKPITKTDIRAVALKLSKAGKQKELADIFAKFGCKKLSDFDSRTEDYLKAVDRKYTKKELDMKLRMCHRFLANELNAILAAMRAGEVDAID